MKRLAIAILLSFSRLTYGEQSQDVSKDVKNTSGTPVLNDQLAAADDLLMEKHYSPIFRATDNGLLGQESLVVSYIVFISSV